MRQKYYLGGRGKHFYIPNLSLLQLWHLDTFWVLFSFFYWSDSAVPGERITELKSYQVIFLSSWSMRKKILLKSMWIFMWFYIFLAENKPFSWNGWDMQKGQFSTQHRQVSDIYNYLSRYGKCKSVPNKKKL
jgi:hypothetical protein